jgi:hypothetical protein
VDQGSVLVEQEQEQAMLVQEQQAVVLQLLDLVQQS